MIRYEVKKFGEGDWGFYTPVGKVSGCVDKYSAAVLATKTEIQDRREALEGEGLMVDALRAYFSQELIRSGPRS
jgi:hypothetical protein